VKSSTQTLLWVGAGAAVLYYLYTKNQAATGGGAAMAPQLTNQGATCGGVCKVAQVSNAISCLFANV
jgi:hypothetical protein